jgi:hypothetical protein
MVAQQYRFVNQSTTHNIVIAAEREFGDVSGPFAHTIGLEFSHFAE